MQEFEYQIRVVVAVVEERGGEERVLKSNYFDFLCNNK